MAVVLGAGIVAAVINVVIYVVARALDVDFTVSQPGSDPAPVSAGMVVLQTLLATILAWVVSLLCARAATPRRLFTIIAAVVLVLSLPNPFVLDASLSAAIALDLMHVVTFAAVVLVVRRGLPERRA